MKLYFYSEKPCYLKVNGEFFGVVNKNYTYANFIGNEILEFTTISNSYFTYHVYLPNENLNAFKFYDGFLIIPKFIKLRNLPYKIISQTTYFNDYTLTIVTDGAIKFYLNGKITATDELPFLPDFIDVKIVNDYLFLIFKKDKFVIFSYSKNGVLSFKNVVTDFTLDSPFLVTLTDENYLPLNFNFTYAICEPFSISKVELLPLQFVENFLPYVFLKCVYYKAPLTNFLSNELKDRESDLIDFIGEFLYVLPPLNSVLNEVICVYNDKISKLNFIITSGKITNIYIDE